MHALDQAYRDPSGIRLMKIAASTEVPDYVMKAENRTDLDSYSPDNFGHPGKRLYPLTSKAETWLSRQYFQLDKKAYHTGVAQAIEDRINKAAAFWNLEDDKPVIKKQASAKHTVRGIKDGDVAFTIDISEPAHYKQAAEYLVNNKNKLTYELRRSMARDLYNTPQNLKCELPVSTVDYLHKAAGFGMNDKAGVIKALNTRVVHSYRTHPQISNVLVKTAQAVDKVTPTVLNKVAQIMDIADRALKLNRYYNNGLSTPEEALYTVLHKHAAAVVDEAVRMSTGDILSKSALLNRKEAIDKFFENYEGEVPYDSPESMVEVVSSLPRQDARELMNTVGLQ